MQKSIFESWTPYLFTWNKKQCK